MKILMLGWEYPPDVSGGLATACKGLSESLIKEGHQIRFVIPKASKKLKNGSFELISASDVQLKTQLNVPLFSMLNTIIPLSNSVKNNYLENGKYKFKGGYNSNLLEEVYWYAVAVSKLATQLEFDIIHAHDWLTYLAGIIAKKISGKPLIVHVHATEFDRSNNINLKVYEIEKQGMLAANKVMAVSNLTRNVVITKYNIDPKKVITTYNGISNNNVINKLYIRNFKGKVVTFLGRITYQKGPEYFIDAAEKVLKKDKNVRFVMAGCGDLMNKMIKKVAKNQLSSHFHFTGFLKGEEVNHMLSISDVFVMPSVSEPFGIVPLEAIRLNVPVIISRQSGVAEVLPHTLVVDYWNTDDLAEAIYGLLHHKALAKTVQDFAHENLKNLTWENTAIRVSSVYSSVA